MTGVWALAALWLGLAVIAGLISIWFRISTALSEIVVGTVAQLLIGAAVGAAILGTDESWIKFLSGIGAIVLTFLAGAELDPHHAVLWAGGERSPEAGRRLGQEGRDAPVEDSVGLVDPPVHREAEHDAPGPRFERLDVEQLVDARVTAVGDGVARRGRRCGGRGHGPQVNGAPLT